MPEFRKWILASAGIALFAGLAGAQVGVPTGPPTGQPLTCTTTNGSVTPTLRADGYTELAGDIVISCGGGSPLAPGTTIPTVNITLFVNTAVTSRLLSGSGGASEALLLIDEPGSGLPGYGPLVPQTVCSSTVAGAGPGGCTQIVGISTFGTAPPTSGVPVSAANCTSTTPCSSPGANIFQGVVNGNSVTFFGIPVLAPASAGASRVFRITNVRTNANGITGGGPTPGSVVASLSTSPAGSLPITNPTLTVGFVVPGLNPTNTTTRNAGNTGGGGATFNQCTSVTVTSTSSTAPAGTGGLQFQENFATAFKTRFQNVSNGYPVASVIQNVPGTIYNSESGFMANIASTGSGSIGTAFQAGVADYGTRLKATFTNVPSGVTLYVSTRDVQNNFAVGSAPQQAQLVVSETALDNPPAVGSFVNPGPVNTVPAVTQTASYAGPVFGTGGVAPGIAPVLTPNGTGTAVWEIVSTNPAQIDTVNFAVYINYAANPANNVPAAPSTMSVTLSFAPTPSGGSFTATAGSQASPTLTIPRFSDSYAVTATLGKFVLCTTDLLYPYVVNVNGFDTGLAIANTTTDPFGTTAQVGTCTLNFYGSSAPSAPFTTPSVATGTVYANLASTLSPGFTGYIIAVCNFQYAHGFAFVSDVGARNFAMGYLALIVNNGTLSRGASGETLGN